MNPTSPPWWAAVAPAEAEIVCAGARHRIRWEAGRLDLLHHEDGGAERALQALGADPPACLALHDRWQRYAGDPALVTLGRRPREAALGFAPSAVGRPSKPEGRRRALVQLLELPLPLLDRLVLTAMHEAAQSWADDEFRAIHGLRLGAALAARAEPAFRRLGERLVDGSAGERAREPVHVQCAPTAPGDPIAIRAQRSSDGLHVAASLPLRWLSSVWGAGISEINDLVVLDITGVREGGLAVHVASWQPRDDGVWQAVANDAMLARDAHGIWRAV